MLNLLSIKLTKKTKYLKLIFPLALLSSFVFFSPGIPTTIRNPAKEEIEILVKESKCSESQDSKITCWQTLIEEVSRDGNLSQAFTMISHLEETDAAFAQSCHSFAHSLGQKIYFAFAQAKDFELPLNTDVCSYGFYHGFMETLAAKGDGLERAKDFCSLITVKYGELDREIPQQCYHGLGHGISATHDPEFAKDIQGRIDLGDKNCYSIANDNVLGSCLVGAFGSIFNDGDFSSKLARTDPLPICRNQKTDDLKEYCLNSAIGHILKFATTRFTDLSQYIENELPEDRGKKLIHLLTQRSIDEGDYQEDYSQEISTCHKLKTYLVTPCLKGYASGLMNFGKSKDRRSLAEKFCQSSSLSKDEKLSCLETVTNEMAKAT